MNTPAEFQRALLLAALRNLYVSACDTRLGYPDRELHEPWSVTQERAYVALVLVNPALADEIVKPGDAP